MNNLLAIAIIVIVIGNAIVYIVKAHKKGTKCIGCPNGECSQCKESEHCKKPL